MATKQTSMHTFSGQLGSTVGYAKFGENFERLLGKTKNPKNPKTQKQLVVRLKFSMLTEFLRRISGFIAGPFKSGTMPATSACFKRNYSKVFSGNYPDFELLYNKLEVSTGTLEMPYSPSAVIDSQMLNVSWTDNAGIGTAKANDQAMLLVYNSAKGQAVYNLTAGERTARLATLTLPSAWSGDSVDIWMAMRDDESKHYSPSVYLGNFSI